MSTFADSDLEFQFCPCTNLTDLEACYDCTTRKWLLTINACIKKEMDAYKSEYPMTTRSYYNRLKGEMEKAARDVIWKHKTDYRKAKDSCIKLIIKAIVSASSEFIERRQQIVNKFIIPAVEGEMEDFFETLAGGWAKDRIKLRKDGIKSHSCYDRMYPPIKLRSWLVEKMLPMIDSEDVLDESRRSRSIQAAHNLLNDWISYDEDVQYSMGIGYERDDEESWRCV